MGKCSVFPPPNQLIDFFKVGTPDWNSSIRNKLYKRIVFFFFHLIDLALTWLVSTIFQTQIQNLNLLITSYWIFRWKECVQKVSQNMHISVGALYVREYVDKEAKKNVEEMVSYIRNELRNTIAKVYINILLKLKCN